MPQAFQARKFFIPKTDPKQEVYKPVPYYFGTLSTQDAADQIAEESSLTKGDVLNVLDRYLALHQEPNDWKSWHRRLHLPEQMVLLPKL